MRSKAPLPSRFTRRRAELFDFGQEDNGKTVYFCV
jgi:hypothetical protein